MSKQWSFETPQGTVTVTECGNYRKSSPFDTECHDYSIECGDYYEDVYEAGDVELADALESAGFEIDRKAVYAAVAGR